MPRRFRVPALASFVIVAAAITLDNGENANGALSERYTWRGTSLASGSPALGNSTLDDIYLDETAAIAGEVEPRKPRRELYTRKFPRRIVLISSR